jgi:hypothetical protein
MNDEQQRVAINPKGWSHFPQQRRYQSFMQNDYTALLVPTHLNRNIPGHPCSVSI